MMTFKTPMILIAAIVLAVVIGSMKGPKRAEAQGNRPNTPVEIAGPLPLPVTGDIHITNLSNPVTSVLLDQLVSGITFGASRTIGPFDISGESAIRINLNRLACTGCGPIEAVVFSSTNSILEIITLPATFSTPQAVSRLYEMPGTSLRVVLRNPDSAPSSSDVRLTVFQRH
jgi:hypothetical protein